MNKKDHHFDGKKTALLSAEGILAAFSLKQIEIASATTIFFSFNF